MNVRMVGWLVVFFFFFLMTWLFVELAACWLQGGLIGWSGLVDCLSGASSSSFPLTSYSKVFEAVQNTVLVFIWLAQ